MTCLPHIITNIKISYNRNTDDAQFYVFPQLDGCQTSWDESSPIYAQSISVSPSGLIAIS